MKTSLKKIFSTTLFVQDLQKSKAFYRNVFDVAEPFEDETCVIFELEGMYLKLNPVASAHELVEPAKVGRADAGVRVVHAFVVDDVDAVCAELAACGVALINGPVDRPWGMRTACFTDLDGHVWGIAQDSDPIEDAI